MERVFFGVVMGDGGFFVEATHVLLLLSDFGAEVFGQTQHVVVDWVIIIGTPILFIRTTTNHPSFLSFITIIYCLHFGKRSARAVGAQGLVEVKRKRGGEVGKWI
jgi:hypothetical protein